MKAGPPTQSLKRAQSFQLFPFPRMLRITITVGVLARLLLLRNLPLQTWAYWLQLLICALCRCTTLCRCTLVQDGKSVHHPGVHSAGLQVYMCVHIVHQSVHHLPCYMRRCRRTSTSVPALAHMHQPLHLLKLCFWVTGVKLLRSTAVLLYLNE